MDYATKDKLRMRLDEYHRIIHLYFLEIFQSFKHPSH